MSPLARAAAAVLAGGLLGPPAHARPVASPLMVDPAIDRDGEPFDYFAYPVTVLGVMDGADGTQVTPEGYLFTGAIELRFYTGERLQPVHQRIKRLRSGRLPIVEYSTRDGDLEYSFVLLAATLDGTPLGRLVNFVRVRVKNLGRQPARAHLATAVLHPDPDHRALKRLPQDPGWSYRFGPDYAAWGERLVYRFDPARSPRLELVPGRPGPGPASARELAVVEEAPTLLARFALDLAASDEAVVDLQLPFHPIPLPDEATLAALRRTSFDAALAATGRAWEAIFARGPRLELAEAKVVDTFWASLMYDLLARDQVGDDYVQNVNEFQYDAFWLRDAAFIARSYDLLGYHDLAGQTLRHFLGYQGEDGNFASHPGQLDGWGQTLWAFGQHLALSGDSGFAGHVWPAVERAVAWLETTLAADPHGLLPPANARDNEAIEGRYTDHNLWAATGLGEATRLARAAGHAEQASRIEGLRARLVSSLGRRLAELAARTGGAIPPGLDVEGGQDWGNLLAAWPGGTLDAHDPWVSATLARVRPGKYAEGLMTYLDGTSLHHYLTTFVTHTLVLRGEQREALEDLYALLVHTSAAQAGFEWHVPPWGSRDYDQNFPPHGWFAALYNSLLRTMLVREQGEDLHLASVLSPAWLQPGSRLAAARFPTEFGRAGFTVESHAGGARVRFAFHWRSPPRRVLFHLPFFASLHRARADGREVRPESGVIALSPDVATLDLEWTLAPHPELSYEAAVERFRGEYRARYAAHAAIGGATYLPGPRPLPSEGERRRAWTRIEQRLGVAIGRKVTSSGGTEGEHRPEYAVDGRADDPDLGWYAGPNPRWLAVDLGAPTRVGAVTLFTHWGGRRVYRYTIEVSPDGRTWRQVVDARGNSATATRQGYRHALAPPVLARHVRVTVLENSANDAAHVIELRVFAEKR